MFVNGKNCVEKVQTEEWKFLKRSFVRSSVRSIRKVKK